MRAVHRGQTSARHASWFPEQNCMGKNSRNNKIYVKQVASVIENCKLKSNYTKGKFKTFRTQILFNCGYSNDLPFPLDLYQKRYMCLIKIPGHAAALLSFGVINSSWTANLASSFAHAQYVWPLCIACSVCLSEIAAILFINRFCYAGNLFAKANSFQVRMLYSMPESEVDSGLHAITQ